MAKNVLITGWADFIGSHLKDELINKGFNVKIYDNLTERVNGPGQNRPTYLNKNAELIVGDVRDEQCPGKALTGIDSVFHFDEQMAEDKVNAASEELVLRGLTV